MYAVVARFEVRPEAVEEFDALARWRITEAARNEPGLVAYAVHRVDGEPLARVFYEIYRDREAFREHRATPQTAEFLARHAQYVQGSPRMELLEPLHTAGRLTDTPV
ncbi:putative quinol monooxygenase [Streptomyces spiralis]|uniref:putative quinol monooxygenase n=1 Tax=Streptomyces spiralis TaxID=66376 RepID=UPI0036925ECB